MSKTLKTNVVLFALSAVTACAFGFLVFTFLNRDDLLREELLQPLFPIAIAVTLAQLYRRRLLRSGASKPQRNTIDALLVMNVIAFVGAVVIGLA